MDNDKEMTEEQALAHIFHEGKHEGETDEEFKERNDIATAFTMMVAEQKAVEAKRKLRKTTPLLEQLMNKGGYSK